MKSPETRETPLRDIDQTLELVRHMLEDYNEEIPSQMVCEMPNGVLLKCQKNWFQGVVDVLQIVQQHQEYRGQISHPDITSFLARYTSRGFHDQERTTVEDIKQANSVLEVSRTILNEMKKK